jgi:hypothetical protein
MRLLLDGHAELHTTYYLTVHVGIIPHGYLSPFPSNDSTRVRAIVGRVHMTRTAAAGANSAGVDQSEIFSKCTIISAVLSVR